MTMPGLYILEQLVVFFTKIFQICKAFFLQHTIIAIPVLGAIGFLLIILILVNIISKKRAAVKYGRSIQDAPVKQKPARKKPKKIPRYHFRGSKKTVTLLEVRCISFDAADTDENDFFKAYETFIPAARKAVNKTGGSFELYSNGCFCAAWGDKTTSGSPAHDALNAVRAALMLRLIRTDTPLHLAMGISGGTVVSGKFGEEKNLHCRLGNVNIFAQKAREQSENNGVDIALSAKTWRLVKEYIVYEELPSIAGSSRDVPIRIFALINIRAAAGITQPPPTTLNELQKII